MKYFPRQIVNSSSIMKSLPVSVVTSLPLMRNHRSFSWMAWLIGCLFACLLAFQPACLSFLSNALSISLSIALVIVIGIVLLLFCFNTLSISLNLSIRSLCSTWLRAAIFYILCGLLLSSKNQLSYFILSIDSDNVNKYSNYSSQTILRLWINFKRCKIRIVKNFWHAFMLQWFPYDVYIRYVRCNGRKFEINAWSFDDSNAHTYIHTLIELEGKVNSSSSRSSRDKCNDMNKNINYYFIMQIFASHFIWSIYYLHTILSSFLAK